MMVNVRFASDIVPEMLPLNTTEPDGVVAFIDLFGVAG